MNTFIPSMQEDDGVEIVVESAKGAALQVERINFSDAVRQSLTTITVTIGPETTVPDQSTEEAISTKI